MPLNMNLGRLSFTKQLLFGLCLTERILHFFVDFDRAWESSNYEIASTCMNDLYDSVKSNDSSLYSKYEKKIIDLIPDSDEYEGKEALFAQDTGISLLSCLKFSQDNDLNKIRECISKIEEALDVIEIVVYDNSDKESDEAIEKETALQNELILLPTNLPETITDSELKIVRDFAVQNMVK